MTECERLIEEGKLSASFLQAEQRVTFVPTELKKLWALQIDLVKQVEAICQRHNLKYFAVFGTALGAVRHHGFISWDDDMDIALMRNDYNLFCKYAKQELEEPYFLQLPTTDKNFYSDHAFLRNSNATCIVDGDARLKINNGAIIHIMPIDAYTNDRDMGHLHKRFQIQHNVAYNNYHYRGKNNHKCIRMLLKVMSPLILMGTRLQHFKRHEQICNKLWEKEHSRVGFHTSLFRGRLSRLVYDKNIFNEAIWVPFEYTTFPIPVGWKEMLKSAYGDYMKLPPEEKRIYKHSWEHDSDTPYREYCNKKYGVKY